MKNEKLNEAQIARLEPYEKFFGMAIRSGYCSALPSAAIDEMKDVWKELTGRNYPVTPGCSHCYFNIIRDMGQLYFAATGKDPFDVPRRVKKSPVSAPKPLVSTESAPKAETPAKPKKQGNKRTTKKTE